MKAVERLRLRAVDLIRLHVPMKAPFRAAHGTTAVRDVVVVRVVGDEGEGWGECAALPEPTYTAEYAAGAFAVLRDHLAPRLLAGTDPGVVCGHPMAVAALRTAVLDARLRVEGTSLAVHLGAVRATVPAGVAVGRCASIDDLLNEVGTYRAAGYTRVKLKIEPGWDVQPVRAVIDAFASCAGSSAGPGLTLVADANGSYSLDDEAHVRSLDALDELGLAFLEQPLAADRLLGHARLAERLRTPLALDETITSSAVAADAFTLGACRAVSVKAGRVGGVEEALSLISLCERAGVDAWIGGMLETGLGRAAAVALAAVAGISQTGDLSASDRYFDEDITEPFTLHDGALRVPDGPGLGRRIDLVQQRRFIIGHETVRPVRPVRAP